MFYALVKFEDNPDPQIMASTNINYIPLLVTLPGVEWVSPPIANGNALAFRRPTGGQALDGAHDYYVSAYRPFPPQSPEFSQERQEALARESQEWETNPNTEQTQAISNRNKIGFSL